MEGTLGWGGADRGDVEGVEVDDEATLEPEESRRDTWGRTMLPNGKLEGDILEEVGVVGKLKACWWGMVGKGSLM